MDTYLHCPACSGRLAAGAEYYRCEDCARQFERKMSCNVCGDPITPLKACGAVDYFCHRCNELKSKSALVSRWVEIPQTTTH